MLDLTLLMRSTMTSQRHGVTSMSGAWHEVRDEVSSDRCTSPSGSSSRAKIAPSRGCGRVPPRIDWTAGELAFGAGGVTQLRRTSRGSVEHRRPLRDDLA